VTIDFKELKPNRLAMWVIWIPLAVAAIYYSFFAMDRYASTALVAVRQVGANEAPQLPGLAVMLGGVNPASREETLYLREFITSMDMLKVLNKDLQWEDHYADKWWDPLYLVFRNASQEFWLTYYQRMVTAHFDEETGLLTVEVQAFTPELAQQVLKVILDESEKFVNELSHKMAREQMRFAQSELGNARKTYEERREEMIRFQSENNLLDAQATAQSRAGVIADLEAQLTRERITLKGLLANLDANTPQVRQQRARISALEQQLDIENKRLVSPPSGDHLNVIAARYRNLTIDTGIAEEAYKFAVSAVESARVEASKKLRSLVTVVSPNEPDLAIYPQRIYNLITLMLALCLLYGIVRFIRATIEDHRD